MMVRLGFKNIILAVAVASSMLALTESGRPQHASCKIVWEVKDGCSYVSDRLQMQIEKWNNSNCGLGQKCNYGIVAKSDDTLNATHRSPKRKSNDNLYFSFESTPDADSCKVKGYSKSGLWYLHLDEGVNYCNLENLITGSGLDHEEGYVEKTSDEECTEYERRNCKIN